MVVKYQHKYINSGFNEVKVAKLQKCKTADPLGVCPVDPYWEGQSKDGVRLGSVSSWPSTNMVVLNNPKV